MTTYAVCHIIGMTSVVANPVLYAFMNKNFRQVQDIIILLIYAGYFRSFKDITYVIELN